MDKWTESPCGLLECRFVKIEFISPFSGKGGLSRMLSPKRWLPLPGVPGCDGESLVFSPAVKPRPNPFIHLPNHSFL